MKLQKFENMCKIISEEITNQTALATTFTAENIKTILTCPGIKQYSQFFITYAEPVIENNMIQFNKMKLNDAGKAKFNVTSDLIFNVWIEAKAVKTKNECIDFNGNHINIKSAGVLAHTADKSAMVVYLIDGEPWGSNLDHYAIVQPMRNMVQPTKWTTKLLAEYIPAIADLPAAFQEFIRKYTKPYMNAGLTIVKNSFTFNEAGVLAFANKYHLRPTTKWMIENRIADFNASRKSVLAGVTFILAFAPRAEVLTADIAYNGYMYFKPDAPETVDNIQIFIDRNTEVK